MSASSSEAEADLRALMHSDNYKVLFLQGGASLQFSMVPMNLYRNSFSADYIDTGSWTKKGDQGSSKKIGKVNVLASARPTTLPTSQWIRKRWTPMRIFCTL